ncbi:MAG: hypothetical protein U0V72_06840 [Cytophagales bacterium]
MITVKEVLGNEESFNWWLTIMPDQLLYLNLFPKEVRNKLDYSIESLDVLEKYIIENYTMEELEDSAFKTMVDICARYIGETYIRNMVDLKWDMERDKGYYMEGHPCIVRNDKTKSFPPQFPHTFAFVAIRELNNNGTSNTGDSISSVLKVNINYEWGTYTEEELKKYYPNFVFTPKS